MSFSDNAAAYFRAHTDASCTSDKTLGQLKTPKLTQEQMDELLAEHKPRYAEARANMMEDYRAKFPKWLRLLEEEFSVIAFGFGSKKQLLQEFHSTMLADQDCLVVNGFFPSLTVKQILTSLARDILEVGFLNCQNH